MEIDIKEYLSEEEIKSICIEEVRSIVRAGGERIVSNLSYQAAYHIIDGAMTEEELNYIKVNAKKLIRDLSVYNVFRPKDAWGDKESIAWATLQEAMIENKPLIHEKVKQIIEEHDFESELRKNQEYFAEVMIDVFSKAFKMGSNL